LSRSSLAGSSELLPGVGGGMGGEVVLDIGVRWRRQAVAGRGEELRATGTHADSFGDSSEEDTALTGGSSSLHGRHEAARGR
jgi:hypothetical protein